IKQLSQEELSASYPFAQDMLVGKLVFNQSDRTEFVFRVFTTATEYQVLLFLLFLLLYLMILCGNTAIIWVEINHFLCDVPPVLRLACADIHVHQAVLYVVSILVLTIPFLLICVSYVFITCSILCIHSAEGRRRAFSTCSSHLTVVLLQYGCCSLVYLRPRSSTSEDEDRQIALVYTFVTPLLNPLIYTLRNKDVKDALRNAILRKAASDAN
ncbi:hypothetical protein H8959_002451, partial [Pygathrix nigripes]